MSKKIVEISPTPESTRRLKSIMNRRWYVIRQLAEALLQHEDHTANGRSIGLDYGVVRSKILIKFPVVTLSGPHKGQPTKMAVKELQAIVSDLNRRGVKLPFRPRRKPMKNSKKK